MAKPFRSDRGMHLLALPTTFADRKNTQRKNISDMGNGTPAHVLSEAYIQPKAAILVCGPASRTFPVIEALIQQSCKPFVLVGTDRDFQETPLLRLHTEWQQTRVPQHLPAGSGRICLATVESVLEMTDGRLAGWHSHLIVLCLGNGITLSPAVIDQLNCAGDYILLTTSLSRAVTLNEHGFDEEFLLRSMTYILTCSSGGDAKTLLKIFPEYECEKFSNTLDFSAHKDRGRSRNGTSHRGAGLHVGQSRTIETRPVLTQDDLIRLRTDGAWIIYNTELMRIWVAKIC